MEPKQVTFERTYDAPLSAVWQAWTNPEQVKQWWGPNGVIIPECQLDVRVGGKLYIVMEATEAMGPAKGLRWPMEGEFTAVEEGAGLSYTSKAWTEGQEATTAIEQQSKLSLHEVDGKTVLNLNVTLTSVGPDAGMAVQGMQWGYNQQFDKLGEYLTANR